MYSSGRTRIKPLFFGEYMPSILRRDYFLLAALWLASLAAIALFLHYDVTLDVFYFAVVSTPFALNGYLLHAEKLKTREFLKHIKHEIRNPLTTICGIAEIFQQTMQADADSRYKELVGVLASSASKLKNVVNPPTKK
jgi:signal transduction histidine kinase